MRDAQPRARLHFVWTRDVDAAQAFGRLKMARAIRGALSEAFETSSSTIRSVAAVRSPAGMLRAVLQYALALARLRPLPLQCLLFADPCEADRVIDQIPADAAAVYVDGVRCAVLLRRLRRRRPDLAVVTDLDDLMSRRMRLLLDLGQAPSTGYMKGALPGFVEAILGSPALARLLLRYEAATLKGVEKEVVALSDRSVLVSAEDARLLAEQCGDGEKVVGVAPPAPAVRDAVPLPPGPIRFVFVGSDTLRQNELTIDKLVELWRARRFEAPLVIYGEQVRALDPPPGVTFAGYARTLDEIYDPRSVLLSPSYLAGGVKTKVLEAFGWGTAVVGNAVTFEGIDIGDYPLLFETDAELCAVIADPEAWRDRFHAAAQQGAALVRLRHDPDRFAARWADLVHEAIAARR